MLQSDICDYSHAYIVVKGTIRGENNTDRKSKSLVFKNNAPFISCISKVNNVSVDNAEDFDVAMLMYNLI